MLVSVNLIHGAISTAKWAFARRTCSSRAEAPCAETEGDVSEDQLATAPRVAAIAFILSLFSHCKLREILIIMRLLAEITSI